VVSGVIIKMMLRILLLKKIWFIPFNQIVVMVSNEGKKIM
jgi:hypothetical protein